MRSCAVLLAIFLIACAQGQGHIVKRSPVNRHVIGGTNAVRGQYRWIAYIVAGNIAYGGSLIHPQWILTSAVVANSNTNFAVTLGMANRSAYFEDGRVTMQTTTKFVHPQYSTTNRAYNFALLKLPTVISVPTNFIAVVNLPKMSQVNSAFDGISCNFGAWGVTNISAPAVSPNLQVVTLTTMLNTACATSWGTWVSASTICTSSTAGKTPCFSDEGGPLSYQESSNFWTQIGVMSLVQGGCPANMPAIYARVSVALTWIKSTATGIVIRP